MKKILFLFNLLFLCLLLFCACQGRRTEAPDIHFEISDPETGIRTAAELLHAAEEKPNGVLRLAGNIDLGDSMLKISHSNDGLTILGNGFCITSTADCVLRLDTDCSVYLEDLELKAGACGIGCLGNAKIGAKNLKVFAMTDGIQCAGDLFIAEESRMSIEALKGFGVYAKSLHVGKSGSLVTSGGRSAVDVSKNDLVIEENVYLSAVTEENYNALKCWGDVILKNGSTLYVENTGEYHGAEINGLSIEGAVTIMARGGEKGAGLFLFELRKDYTLLGFCEPELRFESGNGSLTFVKDASKIPVNREGETE